MRKTFSNTELQQQFEQEGYVHVPLLTKSEVKDLQHIFRQNTSFEEGQPFLHTHQTGAEVRQHIHSLLLPYITHPLHELFSNYKTCFAYFLAKKAQVESVINVHQDKSLVDENQYKGVTVWCALNDMSEENGCLHVVRRSHLFGQNIRGSGIDMPYEGIKEEVEQRYVTPIRMKAGEAVIFDHRLWHYSPTNYSSRDRVAVGAIAIPQEAGFVHFQRNGQGKVEKYCAGDDFPLNFDVNKELLPSDCKKENEFSYELPSISKEAFMGLYRKHNSVDEEADSSSKNGFMPLLSRIKKKLTGVS